MSAPLLTQQAAAARIGISLRTFQRVLADGEGPPVMPMGARKFIHPDDLDVWLEHRREAARHSNDDAHPIGCAV